MGMVIFIIASFIAMLFDTFRSALLIGLIACFVGGIVWELFENTVLVNTRLKFNRTKDSWINSITDQIFVVVGSIVEFNLFATENLYMFLALNTIIIVMLFYFYFICKRKTICK